METWDALRARRNVRTFTDQAISQADLDRITEAGWRAPSASNSQPWDFIVCTDRDLLTELATLWQGAGHVANSAATIVLIAPDNEERRPIIEYDLGQATLQMMVAAADLGIGTAHASIGEKDRAREILGFPDDKYAAYFISMGYPADRPLKPISKPNRRPIDEVVHHNHW
jgi:nitroreductase